MKKYFAIPIACLILLSGMHFTVATHFCSGEIAATRISVTGKMASCGMESNGKTESSSETRITVHCCDNELTVYSVDNDYSPSVFHFNNLKHNMPQEFSVAPETSSYSKYASLTNFTNVSPPGNYLASAVCMADICVFRI